MKVFLTSVCLRSVGQMNAFRIFPMGVYLRNVVQMKLFLTSVYLTSVVRKIVYPTNVFLTNAFPTNVFQTNVGVLTMRTFCL
jgi:hypothetical protein